MTTEGWALPTSTARKFHYFRGAEGRSLCGKYGLLAVLSSAVQTDTGTASSDDCVQCRRKLEAVS